MHDTFPLLEANFSARRIWLSSYPFFLFFRFGWRTDLCGAEIVSETDIEVGRVGDRILHATLDYPDARSATLRPAVVWIHGGGWAAGSYKENPGKQMAQRGFFTASIEYRFSKEAKWPAQLEDCQMAIRWLKSNASKFNIDPNRIGVWGHSAGGHLAACLGTMGDGAGGQIRAVVDLSGPADFTTGKSVYGWAIRPLLDDQQLTNLDKQRDASPLFAVKPGLRSSFLIIHGEQDKVVPSEESVRLHEALQKAGVASELLIVKGCGHEFQEASEEQKSQLDRSKIQDTIDAFFQRILN